MAAVYAFAADRLETMKARGHGADPPQVKLLKYDYMNTEEIELRVAKARQLHADGCNCCQSVVLAFADLLPVDEPTAAKMAAPFGRGISGLRETCGCVTGMAMVCGLMEQSMIVKGLGNRFREENGDLNCMRLLQLQGRDHSCNDLVACAARLLGETL